LNAEREAAREAERKRVAEIIEVGERFGAQDLAREVINSGGSVDELNRKILERGGHRAVKADSPEIGLTDKEVREFSVVRLLDALAHPQDRKAQERAAFEMEASRAAADKMKRDPRGALVPYDVLSRAMSVGSAADGGNLVATELMAESFVDLLRNVLAARQCGATLLTGLNGNVAIPRQTSGAAAFWLAEGGSSTESSATFDQVGLTPKTVGAHTEISRKLLKQSSIDIEQFVRRELAITLATAVDNAAINGTGASNEPIGIRNTTGIGSVVGGANGAAPTWDHIVDLETAVANANVIGDLCYLTNAKVRGALKKTAVDSGSGLFVWDRHSPDAPLNGYRAVVSNQVPSNLTKGTGTGLSSIICGNFSDLLIGLWGGLDIQVNPYSADTSGAVRITAFQDADVSVRHPESFAVMDDAIA
jgi:HK97 family phage major capsid protein